MDIPHKKQVGDKPVIGITLGDINGIGPEVIIKALSDGRVLNHLTPLVFGSSKVLSFYRKMLNIEDFHFNQIKSIDELNHKKINLINCWPDTIDIKVGQVTPEAGNCAYEALVMAMSYLKDDRIDAMVTGPINKKNIQRDDFRFVGHTDYITQELGEKDSLMLMVADDLRIGVVTAHISLQLVSSSLTRQAVSGKLNLMLKTLKKDFGISKPRVAVLSLNPHGGENGLLGNEEIEVIEPVIMESKEKGNLVFGPFPSDGFFGSMEFRKFDGILAMYHDQGLIPFKMLGFEQGVNFTAGISKVRTSPDHGTAYSLAGKNVASHHSMLEAIYLAAETAKIRKTSHPQD